MSDTATIDTATLSGLDWDVVLTRLMVHAQTARGRSRAAAPDFTGSLAETEDRYAAVAEVMILELEGSAVPLGSIADIAHLSGRAARGEVLEAEELVDVGHVVVHLQQLRRWAVNRAEEALTLAELAAPIDIDPDLGQTLEASFDAEGQVSGARYPEVARLRARINQLRSEIRATLERMVAQPEIAAILQDQFITQRGGRFVLPIRTGSRKGLGIVHDTSRSGETAYVEPAAVVEPQNELKTVAAELRREEWRVLTDLSRQVGEAADAIERALAAATELDLASARARLGLELDGCVPTVRSEGVIHLYGARHPVLALREVAVVANDLRVDSQIAGLVLSGPNAGGKTVALKTIGLAALMVRAGIPVPVKAESRVDWLPTIRAVVGDQQAVSDDLSTFSAQMVHLREALDASGPGALILLDEVGVGTDPAQGAALAQAVVEALVDTGARVVLTTHFADLKDLAASDERMQLSGAVFANGAPTYRIEADLMGHSHALAVAREMKLPAEVIDRARSLLDSTTRRLDDLVQRLEEERVAVSITAEEQAEEHRRLTHRAEVLEKRTAKLDSRRDRDEAEAMAAFRVRLKESETEVKGLIAQLQDNPNLRDAGAVLDLVKTTRAESAPPPPVSPEPIEAVAVGDRVTVLGELGEVVAVQGDRIEVDVRGKRLRVRRDQLSAARGGAPRNRPTSTFESTPNDGPSGVRTVVNTVDLRGMRVDEAIDTVAAFLDRMILSNEASAFLLHGHGTGALKSAVRAWLPKSPYGSTWRPAGPEEGGDAFTVVVL
jgi:DNA mismatch repair protein MutS2